MIFKKPSFIVIHHSAVSYMQNADQFEANNSYHRAKWNFISSLGYYLGYNYEIAPSGRLRQARADGEQTAAVTESWATHGVFPRYTGWMNDGRCIHICLDGNFDVEKPMPEQVYALRDLMKQKCTQYGIPAKNIYFHRNFAPKTCPGRNLELGWIRNLLNAK